MDSTRLYALFRSDIVDLQKPYLWSDDEVWIYMDTAYKTFARLTGGIPDFTSDITRVRASAGKPTSEVSRKILRVMSARRLSDGRELEVINSTDIGRMNTPDYGQLKPVTLDETEGPLRCMVIGMQRGVVRWVNVPAFDEEVALHVYRLPLVDIVGEGQEFDDVDEHHHIHLLLGMKALAYRKQDAETFDRARADENELAFARYCAQVKSEMEREKHKTRVVAYGGL